MSEFITRRQFLGHSILATTAVAVSSLEFLDVTNARAARGGAGGKVIILGAGLAGLSVGYELTQAGNDVVIFEARPYAGGRVHTLRKPFADGLYAEAGATRIPEDHDLTMKYVKLFDLTLDEFRPIDLLDVQYIHGKRIVAHHGDPVDWPVDLTLEEKDLGPTGLRQKYINPVLSDMGDVSSPDWVPPDQVKKYDDMTWIGFLRGQGLSPGAIELLTLGHSGGMADEVSALQMLRVSAQSRKRRQMYKIRGGNDLLPQAFASRLAKKIRYSTPVVRIDQDDRGVRATVLDSGKQQIVEGARLISAIPFSVLRTIEISPKFSPEKQRAIDQLWYTSIARTYLQTKKRFWLDEGVSGFGRTDLPILETWDLSHNLPGAHGILLAYSSGEPARRVAAMREPDRISFALEHMEQLYPGLHEQYELGTSVCWDEEQWTRGGWAWLKPGQAASILPHVARPEGRIHFAGDHTTAWSSWMQGALQSGNRVAAEIASLSR